MDKSLLLLLICLILQGCLGYNVGRGSQIDLTEQDKQELSSAIVDYQLSVGDARNEVASSEPELIEDKNLFQSFLTNMKYYWNYVKRQVNKKKEPQYLAKMEAIKHQMAVRSSSELTMENRMISAEALQYALVARNMRYKEVIPKIIGPKTDPRLCETYQLIYEFKSKKFLTAFALYESAREYVLAFKGTSSKKELFLIDLNIGRMRSGLWTQAGAAHRGFVRAFEHMLPELLEAMKLVATDKQLIVTGHSLGGALATLQTEYLAKQNPPMIVDALYTFGMPQVGNKEYVRDFDRLMAGKTKVTRVSLTDGVAKDYVTLPLIPGFKHISGQALMLPCENKLGVLCKFLELHSLKNYITSLSNAALWKCQANFSH